MQRYEYKHVFSSILIHIDFNQLRVQTEGWTTFPFLISVLWSLMTEIGSQSLFLIFISIFIKGQITMTVRKWPSDLLPVQFVSILFYFLSLSLSCSLCFLIQTRHTHAFANITRANTANGGRRSLFLSPASVLPSHRNMSDVWLPEQIKNEWKWEWHLTGVCSAIFTILSFKATGLTNRKTRPRLYIIYKRISHQKQNELLFNKSTAAVSFSLFHDSFLSFAICLLSCSEDAFKASDVKLLL